jgi:nucleoside-diphosphate-sugar epimerase
MEKARAEIGFEYKYSLEEGLLRLIEWRRTHAKIGLEAAG